MDNKKLIEETFNLIEERLELMKRNIGRIDGPLCTYDFPKVRESWNGYLITIWVGDSMIEFEFSFDLIRTIVFITTYPNGKYGGTMVGYARTRDFFKYKRAWKEIRKWTDNLNEIKRVERDRNGQKILNEVLDKYKG